jgi:hypothetical protein
VRKAVVQIKKTVSGKSPLLDMVLALHPSCRLTSRLNGRQQNGNQHANDTDDDEEFDKGEGFPAMMVFASLPEDTGILERKHKLHLC